jgi:hypothetical protein
MRKNTHAYRRRRKPVRIHYADVPTAGALFIYSTVILRGFTLSAFGRVRVKTP